MTELDRESILALDNITLDLPVAGAASRGLACIIDAFFVFWLAVVLLAVCAAMMLWTEAWGRAAMVAIVFLLDWGYFAGMEVTTGGRTLGKMALHLRVVDAAGGEAGAGALLLRNLVREIDLIIGLPLMAWDPLARRLGDRLAGTVVVHERRGDGLPVLQRVPPAWSTGEVRLVESFLARAPGLADQLQALDLASRLLRAVERDAPELVTGLDPRDPMGALRQALQVAAR